MGLAATIALTVAGVARANQGVEAGFDFFQSLPGTHVDLSAIGIGVVPMEGVPLDPGCMGEADTIVRRDAPVPIGGGTIDIELVSLQLKSVDPVDLTPLGGPLIGVFSDLYATVDVGDQFPNVPVYDPLLPSVGQMEIQHQLEQGGSFQSCFGDLSDPGTCAVLGVTGGGVYADAIFVVPGGDPNNLGDVIQKAPAPRITLYAAGATWVHDDQLPVGSGGPGCGPFGGLPRNSKVTSITHVGPHLVQ
ncbi:MAG: hypothetical protein JRG84_19640, partial [Deltaproteobacteria bacterium]|nr:hypothetical protein [Deltaproteobacteria bacterium]